MVVLLSLLVSACSSVPGSSDTSSNQPSSERACSLLTRGEAGQLLGGPTSIPIVNAKQNCSYAGPTGSSILLDARTNDLPKCVASRNCHYPAGTLSVDVDGVKANWIPAAALLPNGSTQPGASTTGALMFIRGGHFVSIDVERASNAEAIAEQALAFILRRL